MQVPDYDAGPMLHSAHVEFGRMARRTVNASYYVIDIAGAQAGTHRRIPQRRDATNPANPFYQPLEGSSGRADGLLSSMPGISGDLYRPRGRRQQQRPVGESQMEMTLKANERANSRPTHVHERQDFRDTNYTGDIAGAQALTGPRMASGVSTRRQLNPMDPRYDWGLAATAVGSTRSSARDIFGRTRPQAATQVAKLPAVPKVEWHLGPGMSLVKTRAGDHVPSAVRLATLRSERMAQPVPDRAKVFADQMASSLSYFHQLSTAPPAGVATHSGAHTPPLRDPRLILDRSLTTSDIAGSMAHRTGESVRQRRTIRNPMVLIPRDDGAAYTGLRLPSTVQPLKPGETAAEQLAAHFRYESTLSGR